MTIPYYDVDACEAEMRRVEMENHAAATARAPDAPSREFVTIQHRLRDISVLPRLEAIRALNRGETGEMVVAALAVKLAVSLHNMSELFGVSMDQIRDIFDETLDETLDALDAEDETDGFIHRSTEVTMPAGRA